MLKVLCSTDGYHVAQEDIHLAISQHINCHDVSEAKSDASRMRFEALCDKVREISRSRVMYFL